MYQDYNPLSSGYWPWSKSQKANRGTEKNIPKGKESANEPPTPGYRGYKATVTKGRSRSRAATKTCNGKISM